MKTKPTESQKKIVALLMVLASTTKLLKRFVFLSWSPDFANEIKVSLCDRAQLKVMTVVQN